MFDVGNVFTSTPTDVRPERRAEPGLYAAAAGGGPGGHRHPDLRWYRGCVLSRARQTACRTRFPGAPAMLDVRWRAKVERALEPVGRALVRAGITADWLTLTGLAFSVLAALAIANGYLIWGLVGLFATGVPDILDGTVARHSGRAG